MGGTRHQQKQLVKQKLIRASLTEEGTGINQHSLRAKDGRRTSRRRGHRTGAQVLTPHWAPSPQNVNHSSPSGVCCKQAPPETSRMKRKHLPTEQIPGLSVRGGETTSHIRHRSQSTPHPPLHPETEQGLHSAEECLQHGLPAAGRGQTHGHCKPLGVASQERRWQAQVAPPPIPLWTGNLCPGVWVQSLVRVFCLMAKKPKHKKDRSNTVTYSIKTFFFFFKGHRS